MEASDIIASLEGCSLKELLNVSVALNRLISKAKDSVQGNIEAAKPEDYICSEGQYLESSSFDYHAIKADLESLNMKNGHLHATPQTRWLTSIDQQYTWSSKSGHKTVKHPQNIENFSIIHKIMKELNSKYNVSLNSCLVSYFKNGHSKMKYHDDSEETLDQDTPMFVFSLGAERTVDFIHHGQDGRSKPLLSLTPADGSLYIMKPGCQQFFQHRVRGDNKVSCERFSLSFRRMVPQAAGEAALVPIITTPIPAVSTAPTPNLSWSVGSSLPISGSDNLSPVPSAHEHQGLGSPGNPEQDPYVVRRGRGQKKRKTTVILGSSITKWIRAKNLGLQGRKVINLSKSGAKIRDITQSLREFFDSHEDSKSDNIDKIIVSIGTNDIKYSQHGVGHLRKFLIELANTAKDLFPHATLIFQSCLPIKVTYSYTVRNVLDFNSLLREICLSLDCVYLDCFNSFLSSDREDYNKYLYSDWLHLNGKGLAILAKWFKYVVNQSSFDKVVNWCPFIS